MSLTVQKKLQLFSIKVSEVSTASPLRCSTQLATRMFIVEVRCPELELSFIHPICETKCCPFGFKPIPWCMAETAEDTYG